MTDKERMLLLLLDAEQKAKEAKKAAPKPAQEASPDSIPEQPGPDSPEAPHPGGTEEPVSSVSPTGFPAAMPSGTAAGSFPAHSSPAPESSRVPAAAREKDQAMPVFPVTAAISVSTTSGRIRKTDQICHSDGQDTTSRQFVEKLNPSVVPADTEIRPSQTNTAIAPVPLDEAQLTNAPSPPIAVFTLSGQLAEPSGQEQQAAADDRLEEEKRQETAAASYHESTAVSAYKPLPQEPHSYGSVRWVDVPRKRTTGKQESTVSGTNTQKSRERGMESSGSFTSDDPRNGKTRSAADDTGTGKSRKLDFWKTDAIKTMLRRKDRITGYFREITAANIGSSGDPSPENAGSSHREKIGNIVQATDSVIRILKSPIALGLLVLLFFPFLILCVSQPEIYTLANASSIREVVRAVNQEYSQRLEEIKETPHDELRTEGTPPDWRTVLALYTALSADAIETADDLEMTDEQKELLRSIFWDMNELSFYTDPEISIQTFAIDIRPTMLPDEPHIPTEEPTEAPTEPPTEPEPITLVIVMAGKTAQEGAQQYNLTAEQRGHMEEMLLPENAMLLNEILWDVPYIVGPVVDGWAYPLPVEGRVSNNFGMRLHPITGEWKMHNAIDIGVDEGTPIFAVRDGTVTLAAYDSASGNYVRIDHNDGFTSIYLHMIQYCVSSGQEVNAGQVIGYVGNTGLSTSAHLHIGITYNGSYIDPSTVLHYQNPNDASSPDS